MDDIIIIGGGLAGLISAIQLAEGGLKVLVIEKKTYPFHRVCGEYISNEVLPFLSKLGVNPFELGASNISRLQVSAASGKDLYLPLGLGGFGISRYRLDNHLYELAKNKGVRFLLNSQASEIAHHGTHAEIKLNNGQVIFGELVIGCFGKRSNLDRQLDRAFFKKKSPYMGVKYHIQTDHPDDLISLHIFKDGYCGISKIEDNKFCLCYLALRKHLKAYTSIREMEIELLGKNPHLKRIFRNAFFVFEKPEVINEISFEKKTAVEKHVVMVGDAVGMISPLCGNGMAMAIHSAKILSDIVLAHWKDQSGKGSTIELKYQERWNKTFSSRLWMGRKIQNMFGNELLSSGCITVLKHIKPASRFLVDQTHGKPFS